MTEEEEYLEVHVENYMHGYCMFLAAALHQAYGFPIGLMTIDHSGDERLSHAWVILPNGKHLDIQGEQTLAQVTYFSADAPDRHKVYAPATLAHLEQVSGTKLPADDADVIEALAIAEKFLKSSLMKPCTGRAMKQHKSKVINGNVVLNVEILLNRKQQRILLDKAWQDSFINGITNKKSTPEEIRAALTATVQYMISLIGEEDED